MIYSASQIQVWLYIKTKAIEEKFIFSDTNIIFKISLESLSLPLLSHHQHQRHNQPTLQPMIIQIITRNFTFYCLNEVDIPW